MSTLVGMEASWALVKWNSELARVVRAVILKNTQNKALQLHVRTILKLMKKRWCLLTFAALLFADVAGVLQVVKSEDILHLSLGVDDGSGATLDASFNLLGQELLEVVWLLVRQKCRQVLHFKKPKGTR